MEGSREAEMIVTFALEGVNYACRLTGALRGKNCSDDSGRCKSTG